MKKCSDNKGLVQAVQRCPLSLHNSTRLSLPLRYDCCVLSLSLSPVPIVSICLIAFGWEIYMDERVRLVCAVCFYFSSFGSPESYWLLPTARWEWCDFEDDDDVCPYCAVYKIVRLSSYKCRTIRRASARTTITASRWCGAFASIDSREL